jgi:molybdopterin/thiamine biosynthesis adenylyltransferase
MKKTRKLKVIGAGGIGGHLIEPLARYLSYTEDNCEITVIDGDKFEDRNKERQRFTACENKADHTIAQLKEQFPKVHFRSKGEYVTETNVIMSIREGDTVFLCVDNHATRKLVSDRCEELDNVTLISGGNDYTDGNVIVYLRENGKNKTKPPTKLYPKIAKPEDKNPGHLTDEERLGCQREAQANPQLLFTNLAIASTMLNCYYAQEQGKVNFEQVYVDILTQRSRPAPDRNSF